MKGQYIRIFVVFIGFMTFVSATAAARGTRDIDHNPQEETLTPGPRAENRVEINDEARRVLAEVATRQAQGPHVNIDPTTTALVLVEMQGEWLAPAGRLRRFAIDRGAAIDAAADRALVALSAARNAGLSVVHVGLRFAEGHPELGRGFYGLRGIQPITNVFVDGTPGAEFDPRFTPTRGDFVAEGRTGGSAFAGSNLETILRNNDVETIIVVGYATDVCVESTMRQGHDLGFNVIVLNDATASFAPALHDHVIEHSVRHWGIALSTDQLVARVGGE